MKKIKVVLIAVAILIGANVSAQNSPLTFGVRAGGNLSTFIGDYTDELSPKFGFNVGVTMDYAFSQNLFLMTGLEFTTKGTRFEDSIMEEGIRINVTATMNPMYLQLPVHLGYKIDIGNDMRLVLRAGPYIAYGIGGQITARGSARVEGVTISVEESEDIFGEDGMERFDFGVGLGVGVEFGRFNVGLGYDVGLRNLTGESDVRWNNMNAHLTVGFRF